MSPFAVPITPAMLFAAEALGDLPLKMLIVFGVAKLMAELFERLGQPGIVGEILAGVLIGPSVLNWIQPSQLLDAAAELGVMFLLFRVGLEVKASELVKVGGTAMLVAVLGVMVPLLGGWGVMRMWGYPQVESIFVGAAMVATSVGITAQVLATKGLLQITASRIILAAAVIDDILGLIVLAAVSSLAKGSLNIVEIALTGVAALAFTAIVATWGTKTMGRVVPKLEAGLRANEAQFHLALVLLFVLAMVATYARMAAIIGAFLAGMALAETVTQRVQDMAHGITELLVPFFLAGIGLKLDLGAFATPALLLLSVVVLVVAIASKLLGCGLGAYALGWSDMLRVGVGMVPRGEVGMVVAQIGLGLGIIEKPVYGVVVFMAVMSTVVAPPLLRLAYKNVECAPAEEHFQLG